MTGRPTGAGSVTWAWASCAVPLPTVETPRLSRRCRRISLRSFRRWASDGREIYVSGTRPDGSYLVYAFPVNGGAPREVAHSEGPTYQNFRFTFDVTGNRLYLALADPQSDIWMAELERR